MLIDATTLEDLGIYTTNPEHTSVLQALDFTTTIGGQEQLQVLLAQPLSSIEAIIQRQQAIQYIGEHLAQCNTGISNGTVVMMEQFYTTNLDGLPAQANIVSATQYKALHHTNYALAKYSVTHFIQFYKGLSLILQQCMQDAPTELAASLHRIKQVIQKHEELQYIITTTHELNLVHTVAIAYFFKMKLKQETIELIDIYSKLDAWWSMAKAKEKYKLSYPEFVMSNTALLQANELFHILLPTPVAYHIGLSKGSNFMFLTGANMAGKSTYIKAVGIAVYLAHIGMAVPAASMQLSLYHGILSNIHVVDNISKGESYFYNEVKRIKHTVEKINDGQKWLVLIDELFKGTNVQDAMKCSSTVIKGLVKMKQAAFILSTHLYEIGEELTMFSNIQFKYFETHVTHGQLTFSYILKNGVSNDRLGYLILQNEGVVALLNDL